jgi:hypothetical protein
MDIEYVELKDNEVVYDNTIIESKPSKPIKKQHKEVIFKPKNKAKPIEFDPDRYTNLI